MVISVFLRMKSINDMDGVHALFHDELTAQKRSESDAQGTIGAAVPH